MKINEFFEKVVHINLADRVDKDNTLKSHLAENGIVSERVEGIDGRNYKENEDGELVRDHQVNENGLRDVYEAYCKTLIGILTQAEIDGIESVLIMQDDVQFTSDAVEVFAECTQRRERTIEVDDLESPIYGYDFETMESTGEIVGYNKKDIVEDYAYLPDDWAVFLLGFKKGTYAVKHIEGRVYKVRDWVLDHCWGISKKMYRPVIEALESYKMPSDVAISSVGMQNLSTLKIYGIFNNGIAIQRESLSDNEGKIVEAKEVS